MALSERTYSCTRCWDTGTELVQEEIDQYGSYWIARACSCSLGSVVRQRMATWPAKLRERWGVQTCPVDWWPPRRW